MFYLINKLIDAHLSALFINIIFKTAYCSINNISNQTEKTKNLIQIIYFVIWFNFDLGITVYS